MSFVTTLYRFLVRGGVAAALASLNETPLARELIFATDARNFKLGNGSDPFNSLPWLLAPWAAASGTDTITATFTAKPVLFDSLLVRVRAAGANTGAVTFNPNGLGALDVKKNGDVDLEAGDINDEGHELLLVYRASPARYELINPATAAATGGGGDGDDASNYVEPAPANIKSRLQGEGSNGSTTFTDDIGTNTWTPNNATISTAQAYAGSASMLFTGASNSSIKCPTNSGFNVGAGDWCVELKCYPTGTHQAFARLFQSRDGDVVSGVSLSVTSSNELNIACSSDGASNDICNGASIATLAANAWNEIVVQVKNKVLTVWVNRSRAARFDTKGLGIYYNAADSVVIGGNATSTSRSFAGHIDEFRFIKGEAPITELGDFGGGGSIAEAVPLLIAEDVTYTVAANKQVLFNEAITVDGELVIDGVLVEV